jgi:hypothetical protein
VAEPFAKGIHVGEATTPIYFVMIFLITTLVYHVYQKAALTRISYARRENLVKAQRNQNFKMVLGLRN